MDILTLLKTILSFPWDTVQKICNLPYISDLLFSAAMAIIIIGVVFFSTADVLKEKTFFSDIKTNVSAVVIEEPDGMNNGAQEALPIIDNNGDPADVYISIEEIGNKSSRTNQIKIKKRYTK